VIQDGYELNDAQISEYALELSRPGFLVRNLTSKTQIQNSLLNTKDIKLKEKLKRSLEKTRSASVCVCVCVCVELGSTYS
jgi:hypothetical protein